MVVPWQEKRWRVVKVNHEIKAAIEKNNLPNVWLDEIDIEECRGTEYHWCSHNQKDTFNICYIPKEKLDIAVSALKYCANEDAYLNALDGGPWHVNDIFRKAREALKELGEI